MYLRHHPSHSPSLRLSLFLPGSFTFPLCFLSLPLPFDSLALPRFPHAPSPSFLHPWVPSCSDFNLPSFMLPFPQSFLAAIFLPFMRVSLASILPTCLCYFLPSRFPSFLFSLAYLPRFPPYLPSVSTCTPVPK